MSRAVDIKAELTQSLKYLRLPTVRQCYEEVAREAERESLSYERYLHELSSTPHADDELVQILSRLPTSSLKRISAPMSSDAPTGDLGSDLIDDAVARGPAKRGHAVNIVV
jgi:hypothetical protein